MPATTWSHRAACAGLVAVAGWGVSFCLGAGALVGRSHKGGEGAGGGGKGGGGGGGTRGGLVVFAPVRGGPRAARDGNRRIRWPLCALQLSLAVGVLAKGLLALVLPGVVGAVLICSERRFDLLARLLHPRAW